MHSGFVPMDDHWLVFLPVFIDGKGPYSFLMDTGCIATSVSPAMATELGQDAGQPGFRPATFAIGQYQFEQPPVAIWDLAGVTRMIGREFAGFIGMRMLMDCRLTIYYPTGRITLEQSTSDDVACVSPDAIPIEVHNEYLTIPVWVNDSGPYRFVIDTGANACFISSHVADILNLPCNEERITQNAIGRDLKVTGSSAQRFQVGKLDLLDFPIIIQDKSDLTEATGIQIDGIVGHSLLSRCIVTLDPRQRLLLLEQAMGETPY